MSPRIPRMDHEGVAYYENGKAWILKKQFLRRGRWLVLEELRWVRVPHLDAQKADSNAASPET